MARISKYLPVTGLGYDTHQALPPSIPPPPPTPNPAPIPANAYIVVTNCLMGAIFGKWSQASVMTEGMGNILWQYDWGPLQYHQAVTPAVLTPTMAVKLANSSVKYFLPSFSVKERTDGGALQAPGGQTPVAISTPAYCIPCQDCQGVGAPSEIGFVLPTSVCFQVPSTRWVGFNFGDFAAGLIGMAGDAASAFIGSKFGGNVFPSSMNAIASQLAGAALGHAISIAGNFGGPTAQACLTAAGVGWGGSGGTSFAANAFGPLVSSGANWVAGQVGDTWGSSAAGPANPSS